MFYCNICVRMGIKEFKVLYICICYKGKFIVYYKGKKVIKSKINKKFNNIIIIYFRVFLLE